MASSKKATPAKTATDAKGKTESTGQTDAKAIEQQVTPEVTASKVDTDRKASELLQKTDGEKQTISQKIVTANNNAKTEASPEVIAAAEGVYQADERRQEEAIAEANQVNDAKTLIQRRREEGLGTQAEEEGREIVAESEAELKPQKFDADSDKAQTLDQLNAKVEQIRGSEFTGSRDEKIIVGNYEREPGKTEQMVVTRHVGGNTTQELVKQGE